MSGVVCMFMMQRQIATDLDGQQEIVSRIGDLHGGDASILCQRLIMWHVVNWDMTSK